MIVQLLALLGIVALVYRHEHGVNLRRRSQTDALRRAAHRNRRGF